MWEFLGLPLFADQFHGPKLSLCKDQTWSRCTVGFTFWLSGSSPLDTKETTREYDFEWYHDVSDLHKGESYMHLGVKWQRKFKKRRMFLWWSCQDSARHVFLTKREVWIAPMEILVEEQRANCYPPAPKITMSPWKGTIVKGNEASSNHQFFRAYVSFQRQTNGSAISKPV